MGLTELILIIFGGIVFTVSFFLPGGKKTDREQDSGLQEEKIKEMLDQEVKETKGQIHDIVDETINYSMEKTERSMERISNEKIMAVKEYSDTVLEQINKNHQEAVFLYDMLNDKHENLKETVSTAQNITGDVKKLVEEQEALLSSMKQQREEEAQAELLNKEPAQAEFQPLVFEEEKKKPAAKKATTKKAATPKTTRKKKPAEELNEQTKASEIDLSMASQSTEGANNNEKILELHKAGKSNMAIAKELGLGVGEVKLVIDLYKI